jgi:hypothetical protein
VKHGLLHNGKWYLIYLFLYIAFCISGPLGLDIRLETVGYVRWGQTVQIWTLFGICLNLFAMRRFAFRIFAARGVSLTSYCLLCVILGNVWFWLSVPVGLAAFLLAGGVLA